MINETTNLENTNNSLHQNIKIQKQPHLFTALNVKTERRRKYNH